jgi:hypothetical protein
MSGLSEQQIRLLHYKMRGWVAGDFLHDLTAAKTRAVQGQGGGTYYLDDARTQGAWHETTSKGYAVRQTLGADHPVIVALTWAEVREWADSVPLDTRTRIIELGREIRDVMNGWKAYTFRQATPDEDRAEWDAYREARYAEISAHNDAVRLAARPLEDERDRLIRQAMPEPVGEQMDLFGESA